MFKNTKKYLKNESGNATVFFSFASVLVITAVGAAVDITSLVNSKSNLQSMTDQLSLATGVELQSGNIMMDDVDEFSNDYLALYDATDVGFEWKEAEDVLTFTLSKNEPLIFGGFLGTDFKKVAATASVPLSGGLTSSSGEGLNVALVLDTTFSMDGERMDDLKTHANTFLDDIDVGGSSDVYASVIPFADYAKIPVSYKGEPWLEVEDPYERYLKYLDRDASTNCRNIWVDEKRQTICDDYVYVETTIMREWKGCMPSRLDDYNKTANYEGETFIGTNGGVHSICGNYDNALVPMTQDKDTLTAAIDDMRAVGQTYIPSGLAWGWRTLSPEAPLTEVSRNPDAKNAMILMTDGENTVFHREQDSKSSYLLHDDTENNDRANELTLELCENIKADGIEIFTIAFEVTDNTTKSILSKGASSPDNYFDARNSGALSDAFEDISGSITTEAVAEAFRLIK